MGLGRSGFYMASGHMFSSDSTGSQNRAWEGFFFGASLLRLFRLRTRTSTIAKPALSPVFVPQSSQTQNPQIELSEQIINSRLLEYPNWEGLAKARAATFSIPDRMCAYRTNVRIVDQRSALSTCLLTSCIVDLPCPAPLITTHVRI